MEIVRLPQSDRPSFHALIIGASLKVISSLLGQVFRSILPSFKRALMFQMDYELDVLTELRNNPVFMLQRHQVCYRPNGTKWKKIPRFILSAKGELNF